VIALFVLIAALPPQIEGVDLRFLGWSADGRSIALMRYYEGNTVSHSCHLNAWVQDLMTDKLENLLTATWGESGVDGSDDCPKSESAAWARVAKKVEAEISKRQFSGKTPKLEQGAFKDLTFSMAGEALLATSAERGKKVLAKEIPSTCNEKRVAGYLLTPDPNRIAVIVHTEDSLDWCPYDVLVGCNIKSGFKR
jgi:hypothetical protein